MFEKIKKFAMLLAIAGTVASAAVPASTSANAMPRGPVAESSAATVKVAFGRRHHRRFGRIGIYIGPGWGRGRHGWRRCHRFLRRYRFTGSRYWLRRYRRCMRYRYW